MARTQETLSQQTIRKPQLDLPQQAASTAAGLSSTQNFNLDFKHLVDNQNHRPATKEIPSCFIYQSADGFHLFKKGNWEIFNPVNLWHHNSKCTYDAEFFVALMELMKISNDTSNTLKLMEFSISLFIESIDHNIHDHFQTHYPPTYHHAKNYCIHAHAFETSLASNSMLLEQNRSKAPDIYNYLTSIFTCKEHIKHHSIKITGNTKLQQQNYEYSIVARNLLLYLISILDKLSLDIHNTITSALRNTATK